AEKMMAHQFKEPKPINELTPDVPPALVAVVERLMKKAPDQRYGTAAEVVEALRPLAGPQSATPSLAARPQPRVQPGPVAAPKQNPAAPAPEGLKSFGGLPTSSKPSVAPSAPTPKPPALGNLPTRNSLKGATSPAPAASKPEPKAEPAPQLDEK